MNDELFKRQLNELIVEIGTLPQDEQEKLGKIVQETKERHDKLKHSFCVMQESVDFLRLSIKYLIFDLEATRRENGYLRKLLEEDDVI